MTAPPRPLFRSLRLFARQMLRSTVAHGRTHERGQVVPTALVFMVIFLLLAEFLLNVAGAQNVAQRAVDGALRAGGLAALQERGSANDYGRWYVCPGSDQGFYQLDCVGLDGFGQAGQIVDANLAGYASILDRSVEILDVEILNPAAQAGQRSEAFFNYELTYEGGEAAGPECLDSTLPTTSGPYCEATVILRYRIPNPHVLGPSVGGIDITVVVKAGTDDGS